MAAVIKIKITSTSAAEMGARISAATAALKYHLTVHCQRICRVFPCPFFLHSHEILPNISHTPMLRFGLQTANAFFALSMPSVALLFTLPRPHSFHLTGFHDRILALRMPPVLLMLRLTYPHESLNCCLAQSSLFVLFMIPKPRR